MDSFHNKSILFTFSRIEPSAGLTGINLNFHCFVYSFEFRQDNPAGHYHQFILKFQPISPVTPTPLMITSATPARSPSGVFICRFRMDRVLVGRHGSSSPCCRGTSFFPIQMECVRTLRLLISWKLVDRGSKKDEQICKREGKKKWENNIYL